MFCSHCADASKPNHWHSAAAPYMVQGWSIFGPPEKYMRPLVTQIVSVIQLNKHNRSTEHNKQLH